MSFVKRAYAPASARGVHLGWPVPTSFHPMSIGTDSERRQPQALVRSPVQVPRLRPQHQLPPRSADQGDVCPYEEAVPCACGRCRRL